MDGLLLFKALAPSSGGGFRLVHIKRARGKLRARRARWLPEREVDLVYLYSDYYIDAREPTSAQTDFFTVTRMDAWGVSTWFMCTPEAAGKLIAMDYDNLAVKETTIVG